ncbi:MAG: NapC/NirT family cytochrome c [Desulfobulbaceae bacterium]|nr:NapC/NirT family cytochrome c [Pseudomonadota bacterium]MCG2749185.1 NapC/NirT family cytochrome c [Desulfobulbaceae bacterium]
MSNNDQNTNQEHDPRDNEKGKSALARLIQGLWRSPLGVLGIAITTFSITLIMIGMIIDMLGLIKNPYASLVTYTALPALMLFGLFLIPLAIYLQRRKWRKYGMDRDQIIVNLSNPKHRLALVGFIVLTVVNVAIMAVISYEGYHFTDSPYFCGMVCHQVMAPEYTAYQRSAHSRVACVECHIGPGAEWYAKAKISGLRQVAAVLRNTYHRPIPAPVHELRPARDTCEQCHWPEKFHGKKIKRYVSFTNDDQTDPQITEIALHIGGQNPEKNVFEGIHWHVSQQVEVSYLAVDEKRTQIARVKVKRQDGTTDEFVKSDIEVPENEEQQWRVMDCIDCHNRPTHIYNMPEERVDFGLLSKKINPEIPGIREDSLQVITKEYASRAEAEESMISDLLFLQKERSAEQAAKYKEDIIKTGSFLLEAYLGNVWPDMDVKWGTYRDHLGHQYADEGYGCWRCHDEEHLNKSGETISQDCSLCHDEP